MMHPTLITILIGVASMAALLGIDWFVWGRCYGADFKRNAPIAARPQPPRQDFRKAA
jgi:hypothetical protein